MKSLIHNPHAIREHIEWLAHAEAGGCTEVRIISAGPAQVGYFDNASALVAAVSSVEAGNVYVGLQPRPMRLLERSPNALAVEKHGASNDEIEQLSTVLIDIDPVRPTGATKQAATDAEVEHATGAARAAADWIASMGFAAPAIAMTGNGAQLIMRVPPTPLDTDDRDAIEFGLKLFEAEIRAFVGSLELPVRIDRTSDLARVGKLIGTVSRKGDGLGDRPHRASRWVETPGGAPDSALLAHIVDLGMDELRRIDDERQARLEELRVREASEPHRSSTTTSPTERCRRYLDKTGTAVEGQGGSGTALRAARIIFHGFGLDEAEGWPLFCEWNRSKASPPFEESLGARAADSLRRKMLEAIRKPLPAEFGWTEVGELRWRSQPRASARANRGQKSASKGGSNDREGNAAVNIAMNEDEETSGAHSSNVRQGPWEGSGHRPLSAFELPIDSERTTRDPQARVPEPDSWEPDPKEPPPPAIPRKPHDRMLSSATVMSVAECILQDIDHGYQGFVHDAGLFWLYSDGVYRPLPDWWIPSVVDGYDGTPSSEGDRFRSNVTNQRSVQSLLATKLMCRQNTPVGRCFFDDSPALAVFDNGALIVGEDGAPRWVSEHSPDHRAQRRFDFAYEPNLVPRHMLAVMADWFAGTGDGESELRIQALRQYAGHTLLGSLRRKKLSVAVMLFGNGHDGKSTFLNIVWKCLPPESTCALDPAALGAKSACVDMTRAALYGKMANICPDCSAEQWHDTSFLKRVLDHEPVTARRQGQNPFTWRPTLASLFACNKLPIVSDKSWGFFRRWLLIHFPNEVPMGPLRDDRIEDKLLGLEKREIVCWFIDAALHMLRAKGECWFSQPECHLELRTQWAAGDDSVASFINEYTADAGDDKTKWTPTGELHDQYVAWCQWAYGQFRAQRETQGICEFAKRLKKMPVLKDARRGKSNVRVTNRTMK